MGNKCIKCGKRPSILGNDPLKLSEDKIICYTCAKPLSDEIETLWGVEYEDYFEEQKNKVLEVAKINYSEDIIEDVNKKIENIYQYKQGTFKDKAKRLEDFKRKEILQKRKEIFQKQYDSHMMTTGYNFEGYTIKKYIKVISGETVMGTGMFSEFAAAVADFVGEESEAFNNKIQKAKESALDKMVIKSVHLGGNAIIGVDFDYVTFTNNMIGVIVSGTSVYIEKDDENNQSDISE